MWQVVCPERRDHPSSPWEPMSPAEMIQDICASVLPFVMARRKESGGFGATPRLPATIEDTYHALRILDLAGTHTPYGGQEFEASTDEALRSYLRSRRPVLSANVRTTFQWLWCCRAAGIEFDREAVAADTAARLQTADALTIIYDCARILAQGLDRMRFAVADKRKLHALMARGRRSVEKAWMEIYLSRLFDVPLPTPEKELIVWLRAAQNGDGGFGFFPGTTSFIENCYQCARALHAWARGRSIRKKRLVFWKIAGTIPAALAAVFGRRPSWTRHGTG